MIVLSEYMKADHRACDEAFANMENEVADENWSNASKVFESFASDLNHHFDIEEEVMFPAFEARGAGHCNPTPVMIMEHTQMRNVLKTMREDLEAKNKEHFFGLSETLMMTIQQHNMKEEQMMYPMIDESLGDEGQMLLDSMKEHPRKSH
ncbi:MAG: hemerythrin domain-containing protein [Campylobacteraceae bacterium]|nr:hemerythrin domain-containing protein [Campylobacteraceae bacterium]MBT3882292.1 hemerythrin domain-containing protein [Campylobacteraceae bacterium]MBT4030208.1 hemerythrin domain-containing protein [Campylobacteraceae bacterium]MBT4179265.1 hemerythrin domain-containing protein [Campylobacteraceae bacterium]MBT4572126.1 hemerythrin domain-containing protein [Campylobacteraceae bacterium]